MNQPTTPNTENCRLRLCCRNDAHATDCTTYHPSPDSLVNPPSRAEPASQHDADLAALRVNQELSRISMTLAADLIQREPHTIGDTDYLDRDWVMRRIMDWRAEWDDTAKARNELTARFRAAGRNARPEQPASPTVAGSVDTPEVDTAMRVVMRDDFLGWTAREKECFRIGYRRARLAPAAPSEIEAAVELPPKPEGDLGYYASSLNGGVKQWKYSEAALTTYATAAVLKDRASMKGNK